MIDLPDPYDTSTGHDTTAPIAQLADLYEEPYPLQLYDQQSYVHGWAEIEEAGQAWADWLYANLPRFKVGTVFRLVASEPENITEA